jgi:hypothetical protein
MNRDDVEGDAQPIHGKAEPVIADDIGGVPSLPAHRVRHRSPVGCRYRRPARRPIAMPSESRPASPASGSGPAVSGSTVPSGSACPEAPSL